MPTDARVALLLPGEDELRLEQVALPDPGPRDVVVRQFASGVCHSQLHQIHSPLRRNPLLLGHESTGEVVAVGSDVVHVAPGDTVLVTWVPRDGHGGRPARSMTLELPGVGTASCQAVFTWADHTIADEMFVVKAPSGIATDVTSIVGCAVMTGVGAVRNSMRVQRGESVAVVGVGGVGLSAVAAARVAEASPIIAVDLSPEKLDFARRFGATHVVNAAEQDAVAAVHALTTKPDRFDFRGRPVAGVDHAFDCIGLKVTMEQIVGMARTGEFGVARGGNAVLVGVPTGPVELPAGDVLINEKRFVGSFGGSCVPDRDFPELLRWHDEGLLDLDALVTERFALDDINEAVAALSEGRVFGRAILEL